MDIAKEKQSILDYISNLTDTSSLQKIKNLIRELKDNQKKEVYMPSNELLNRFEESKQQYLIGNYKTDEQANKELDKWLNE